MKVANVVPVERPNNNGILFQVGRAFANIHRLPIEINAVCVDPGIHIKDPTIGFADSPSDAAGLVIDYIVEAACIGNYTQPNFQNGFTGEIVDHPMLESIDDRPEVNQITREIEQQIRRGGITVLTPPKDDLLAGRVLLAEDVVLNPLEDALYEEFLQALHDKFYTNPIIDALRNRGPVVTTYTRPLVSENGLFEVGYRAFNVDMVFKTGQAEHYATEEFEELPELLHRTINGHAKWCLRNGGRTHTEPKFLNKGMLHTEILEDAVQTAGITGYNKRLTRTGHIELMHR